MKFVHGKSVLLGIGIGIILTSIVGFIFFSGVRENFKSSYNDNLTGNISKKQNLGNSSSKFVKLIITEDDDFKTVSEKLLSKGLIKNKLEFQVRIIKEGLQTKIKKGEYNIKKGISQHEIIVLITSADTK